MIKKNEYTIPDKHYVTFSSRYHDTTEAPLGFMVPDGTDRAALKRKKTADNWGSDDISPVTTENKLMNGFKILNSQRRYYSNNVVFRILDPRGFELEINADNLERLIHSSTIENGEILSSCMWARKRTANYLISEDDELLAEARAQTIRSNQSVPIKDVSIGDRVLLHSGIEAVYLGRLHPIVGSTETSAGIHRNDVSSIETKILKGKKFIFQVDETSKEFPRCIINISQPNVSQIIKPSENTMTEGDAELLINKLIQKERYHFIDGHGNAEYCMVGMIANYKAKPDIAAYLKPLKSLADLNTLYDDSHEPLLVAENDEGHLLVWEHRIYKNTAFFTSYVKASVENFATTGSIRFKGRFNSYSTYGNQSNKLSDFDWFIPTIEIFNPKTKNSITCNLRN